MSYVNASVNIDIDLEDSEKDTLVSAYKVLKDLTDDMWAEDLEDTDEAFMAAEARDSIQSFLRHINVDCDV